MKPEQTEIKLLIFDLGGVVFTHSFDRALEIWAQRSGADFEKLKKVYAHDEAYALHEIGEISIEEYKAHVCDELEISLPLDAFVEGWNAIFLDEIPGVTEILQRLGQDYQIAALSNTNRTHCARMRQKYGAPLEQFHRVYYSHEISARKPQAKAYLRVLSDFGALASEAVFLDDLKVNIEGAQEVGLGTIHVTDFTAMVLGLKKFGLLA